MHGPCHGNKFRKLKYHLLEFQQAHKREILTFGGAFSNHLYATAATGFQLNIPTIGIIRGEIDMENPTIKKIIKWGMKLYPLERSIYAQRGQEKFNSYIASKFPHAYIIPEGGHHILAQRGISELVREVRTQMSEQMDYWVCPYGTGSTARGIIAELNDHEKMLIYPALKGFNHEKIKNELIDGINILAERIVIRDAHRGGYGKRHPEIEEFILDFFHQYEILLDPVYTGKMFYQLFSDIREGFFPERSTIMVVHTGGLQGLAGYNYRYGSELPQWDENTNQ